MTHPWTQVGNPPVQKKTPDQLLAEITAETILQKLLKGTVPSVQKLNVVYYCEKGDKVIELLEVKLYNTYQRRFESACGEYQFHQPVLVFSKDKKGSLCQALEMIVLANPDWNGEPLSSD